MNDDCPPCPVTQRIYRQAIEANRTSAEVSREEYEQMQAEADAIELWKLRQDLPPPREFRFGGAIGCLFGIVIRDEPTVVST